MEILVNPLKKLHPDWYHATDYRWLDEQDRVRKAYRIDHSNWNKLDDMYRRDMSSWDDSLQDDYPYGDF
jgi:hypothetical protein